MGKMVKTQLSTTEVVSHFEKGNCQLLTTKNLTFSCRQLISKLCDINVRTIYAAHIT